ncbi:MULTISPECIES: hypothetical protein [Bacillus]|uniref:Uncharacterized protein n=3 Tax=Bacillus cereus group TaxID=86661 RepID=A0A4Y1WFW9_BACAN|nr:MULTISPECIES: hypothetical protein [Bacillus]EJT18211.1 hypothetical protein B353_25171 [Bacillus anthracis str. UR-1]EXJ21591.1 hypothetical protein Y693_05810 [Bacillus anthracis str. 95014]AAP25078.1 hypothetical protein BA_1099 [Bacillus anthracis str. Ames]AAT30197.1 hypothetical protein GBAA_1099 [Bacillus anthracis str. 'Ames Ancestor']ACP13805.1 hypothetical protein BAMEG_3478 [Bacillus anthracis str. CDC 684]
MSKFNSDVQGVLQGILKEKQPELLWIVNCRDFSILEIETIHELRDILADELIEKGFDEQDNINDFGRDLEKLIDVFGDLLP